MSRHFGLKQIKTLLRIVIVAACIVYIANFFYTNRDSLSIVIRINFITLSALVLLWLGYMLIHNWRLQLILQKCSGRKIAFWQWFKILIMGNFLNLVFSQLGNVYRGVKLKKEHNISYTSYIASFASFAWMNTCMNLVLAIVTILLIEPNLKIGLFSASSLLVIICAIIIILPITALFFLRFIRFKNHYLDWTKLKLSEVLTTTLDNIKDISFLLKIILLSIVAFIVTVFSYYILFAGFDMRLSLPILAVFCTLLQLSTLFVITPGNIGIQEIAFGFISQQFGIGMAEGILVSFVSRILSTALVILLGVLLGGINVIKYRNKYVELNH
ncbi:MAG: lysylphosphatidylglycerol synthase transmembrane domain-containing protein [Phycisphaerae bacterium]|nr:lysylphosphatidylglycerol synthase transmembrane domain-containing protein [Phycisphaerae bacterium]MDD5381523.1 lysylphosphatidylglycerol synthase transmembrane domain-containing protein [Phycisphaerae bacterium]